MSKKRVLLIGQHPDCFSGNGNMLGACYDDINKDEYDVCAFLKDEVPLALLSDPFKAKSTIDCNIISSHDYKRNDPWGKVKLLQLLNTIKIDIVVFIGLDVWRYADIFNEIKQIQIKNPFIWKMLVPYDLDHIRTDWLEWLNYPDQLFIYSEFGHNLVSAFIPHAVYYRPKLRFNEIHKPIFDEEYKQKIRCQIFPDIFTEDKNTLLFTFVGNNQLRKNIYNIIDGFGRALRKRSNMFLYMHLDNSTHIFNIDELRNDFEISTSKLKHNGGSRKLWPHELSLIYSISDCHVLPSLQEGLSWTVVESKLCGIPSILSDSTAHKDFIRLTDQYDCSETIFPIQPDTVQFIPLITKSGANHVSTYGCSAHTIMESFLSFNNEINTPEKCEKIGKKWVSNCHNFNNLLNYVISEKKEVMGEIL